MVALEPWPVGDLAVLVRRAAPFAELPDSALHAVLDMLSGRYPSTAFAELRPRLVWDRATDVLTGRPGAQRLAVTSGGTIPDRGLFGVFLAGAERAARVGELDEEMVYESRVGDVFLLGSTSWRIEEITPDRVLVSPAPGAGGPDAVLEGRPARPAGRAGPGHRRPAARRCCGRRRRRRAGRAARRRAGRLGGRQPAGLPARAAGGHPRAARRPHGRGRAVPRRAGRLAAGRALRARRPGQRRRGRWPSAAGWPSGTGWTPRSCPPTTASWCGCRTPPTSRPAPTWWSSTPTRSPSSSRSRSAPRRCSRPVPRVRRPVAAAAPPRPAPPPAAVAAAPARRPAARRGPRVRRLPGHPGGRPGVPAGRLRRSPAWPG